MTTKIEWDEKAADAETASIPQKLLNTLVPSYNELADIEAKYNAATNLDAAVEDAIANSNDEESLKLRGDIEKAQKLIARNQAMLEERARQAVLADIDPEFDEQKYRAKHNDLRRALAENAKNILGTFDLLGFVSQEKTETGGKGKLVANTPEAETLLTVLNVAKLGGRSSEGGTSTKTDPAVAEFNRNAKAWAKENGMEVAEKGALSKAVKEAYSKATGIAIP